MPHSQDTEIVIVGSGFAGSLTALILHKIGRRVILLDRGAHPRFAIGESSTPIANLLLAELADRYDLPQLAPLAKYGPWRRAYPQIIRGIKRGFSYFQHVRGEPFHPGQNHARELLVAASSEDERADTHWLRADVDSFLVAQVQAAGIPYWDQTELSVLAVRPRWSLAGRRQGEDLAIHADFLIDATGPGQFLAQALNLPDHTHRLATRSRAIYGHFEKVACWPDQLAAAGGQVGDHPFPCDHAALHQLLDVGWMWQLAFDNGVTSLGFALDLARSPVLSDQSPAAEWRELVAAFPAIAEQLGDARLVAPAAGPRRTGRLQRLCGEIAGENWALLPHTAGFIDPFHSTGIAHSLCGIERLARVLDTEWNRASLPAALANYGEIIRNEVFWIDELVSGCYAALGEFDLFTSYAMLYFAAAHTYEQQRVAGRLPRDAAFLLANDRQLRGVGATIRQELSRAISAINKADARHEFVDAVAEGIAPYNRAGLCDPNAHNMYRHTSLDAVPLSYGPPTGDRFVDRG